VLKTKIEDLLKLGRTGVTTASGRIRTRLAGRSRQVIAVATLAGVASLGLVAAALSDTPDSSSASATAERQRAEAAFQANRSDRESQTPATTASVTPPAPDTPSAAPQTAQALAVPSTEAPKAAPEWVNPMPHGAVSSCFGPRWGTMHAGVDLFTSENEPIQAVGAGTVVAAGWVYSGYGISVTIDHHNGFLTHYAHMNKAAVEAGQEVTAGTLIGYEGSTGDSTGPHLHFEVHAGMWNQIEPAQWLRDHGVDIGGC
jgi:murein DD-endopeptidase MepM/ murein hydrolase activator NlpD